MKAKSVVSLLILVVVVALLPESASAAAGVELLRTSPTPGGGQAYSLTLQALGLITVLTLLPAILLSTTAFIRIAIVLGLLRQALGASQTPPNQVLVGLALFLTFFVMGPTFNQVQAVAVSPYVEE